MKQSILLLNLQYLSEAKHYIRKGKKEKGSLQVTISKSANQIGCMHMNAHGHVLVGVSVYVCVRICVCERILTSIY